MSIRNRGSEISVRRCEGTNDRQFLDRLLEVVVGPSGGPKKSSIDRRCHEFCPINL